MSGNARVGEEREKGRPEVGEKHGRATAGQETRPLCRSVEVSVLEPKVKQDEVTGTTGSTSRKGEGPACEVSRYTTTPAVAKCRPGDDYLNNWSANEGDEEEGNGARTGGPQTEEVAVAAVG